MNNNKRSGIGKAAVLVIAAIVVCAGLGAWYGAEHTAADGKRATYSDGFGFGKAKQPGANARALQNVQIAGEAKTADGQSAKQPDKETVLEEEPVAEAAAPEVAGDAGTEPAPAKTQAAAPTPAPSQGAQPAAPKQPTVTLSIDCRTILGHMDKLAQGKEALVGDGWILREKRVGIAEGETVFDVLLRVCREEKIHMEYVDAPLYDSAYIEGIGNIYEYDAGELSGWMFSVNDGFTGGGCSRCALADGDVVKWRFTCDLGRDIGAPDAAGA